MGVVRGDGDGGVGGRGVGERVGARFCGERYVREWMCVCGCDVGGCVCDGC